MSRSLSLSENIQAWYNCVIIINIEKSGVAGYNRLELKPVKELIFAKEITHLKAVTPLQ